MGPTKPRFGATGSEVLLPSKTEERELPESVGQVLLDPGPQPARNRLGGVVATVVIASAMLLVGISLGGRATETNLATAERPQAVDDTLGRERRAGVERSGVGEPESSGTSGSRANRNVPFEDFGAPTNGGKDEMSLIDSAAVAVAPGPNGGTSARKGDPRGARAGGLTSTVSEDSRDSIEPRSRNHRTSTSRPKRDSDGPQGSPGSAVTVVGTVVRPVNTPVEAVDSAAGEAESALLPATIEGPHLDTTAPTDVGQKGGDERERPSRLLAQLLTSQVSNGTARGVLFRRDDRKTSAGITGEARDHAVASGIFRREGGCKTLWKNSSGRDWIEGSSPCEHRRAKRTDQRRKGRRKFRQHSVGKLRCQGGCKGPL